MRNSSHITHDNTRHVQVRERLDRLARLLDSAVRVPGTNIRFGADAALNVIPGAGTLFAKSLSAYLIWEASRLGVPPRVLLRMIGNVGVDLAISAVPLVGWVGDVFFRANLRNMALLREHLDGQISAQERRRWAEGPVIEETVVRGATA